jgi:hypothetical protein
VAGFLAVFGAAGGGVGADDLAAVFGFGRTDACAFA